MAVEVTKIESHNKLCTSLYFYLNEAFSAASALLPGHR